MNNPMMPLNLNPIYIAISVYKGCIPICDDTIRGSKNCRTVEISISKPIIDIPSITIFKFFIL